MTNKNKKVTKISIIILIAFLLFFSVRLYKTEREFNAFKINSELEVKVLQTQLDVILHKYDSLNEESKKHNRIITEKTDSNTKPNKSVSNDDLLKDSLAYYAKKAKEISLIIEQKNQLLAKKSRYSTEKNTLESARFTANNINVKGVKIYTDNHNTNNVTIQQLRVCFTLMKNQNIKSGSKRIYIQVVNPKNQIISKGNLSIDFNHDKTLKYSMVTDVNYNNSDTDICDYVDLEKNKTVKGKYIINIYSEFVKIGTANFEY